MLKMINREINRNTSRNFLSKQKKKKNTNNKES